MTERELRLRTRIDQLTDERDRARTLYKKWLRVGTTQRRRAELWRTRCLRK